MIERVEDSGNVPLADYEGICWILVLAHRL